MATTDEEYLRRHEFLTMVYRDRGYISLMGLFPSDGQHALHQYNLTDRDLSDERLLAQRRELDAKNPDQEEAIDADFQLLERTYLDIRSRPELTVRERHALINRAVDAHNPIEPYDPPFDPAHPRRKRHRITARGIVRANPDLERLARAIIDAALREAAREERENKQNGSAETPLPPTAGT